MMKFSNTWNRPRRGITFFSNVWKTAGAIVALCGLAAAQEPGMEISGFRVPEYDDQGQMTSQLFGDHAELQSGGQVQIVGARVELYREGEVFVTVQSPHCLYDQKSRRVHSLDPVKADMNGVHLSGTGFHLDTNARTVQVLDDSRVVLENILKKTGSGESSSTNKTIITSKQLSLDYNGRSARFTESVHVLDEELDMTCGLLDLFFSTNNEIDRIVAESDVRMSNEEWQISADRGTLKHSERTAFFEGTVQVKNKKLDMTCGRLNLCFNESNKISWIEALTNVRIRSEEREAYAGRAVYDTATEEFLLEDQPKVVEGRNMMFGDTIRFWRSSGRMVCEPAARIVFYPDEKFKMDLFEN